VSPPATTAGREPARIGVLSPQPVVAAGLHTLLAQGDVAWQVVREPDGTTPPDVVLYDVLLLHTGDGSDLDDLVKKEASVVIAVGRDLRPDLQAQALDRGARAAIPLGVSAEELVLVVRAALVGSLEESGVARRSDRDVPLGSEVGLSRRESGVLRLIAQGYSNQEIADRLFLSINSIKTYIRTTYRKIGVSSRQQAVTWAFQHGFPIVRDETDEPVDPEGSRTPSDG
jgi:DNA-binding NarL/FixJ family response regulator